MRSTAGCGEVFFLAQILSIAVSVVDVSNDIWRRESGHGRDEKWRESG
jgi:hypothetical protein